MADIQTTFSESIKNEPSPPEVNEVDQSQQKPISISEDSKTRSTHNTDTVNVRNNRTTTNTNTDEQDTYTQINVQKPVQNKLKRKKKLLSNTASTENVASVKKRKTKQVDSGGGSSHNTNCSDSNSNNSCDSSRPNRSTAVDGNQNQNDANVLKSMEGEKRVVTKPPLPPKVTTDRSIQAQILSAMRVQPPRLKRKLEEQNTALVQKLSAHAEQMRLEISDLKTALACERSAVRSLRAQNEAEARKAKAEAKKLQCALDVSKKAATTVLNQKKVKEDVGPCKENEVVKLTHDICTLKEANKVLEEKVQICSEAERRKTSDIHELKDSYEIRLTQITKSAKTEINRLLEEIKTKERNIVQLKKEIHTLKNGTNKKDLRSVQHPPEMRKLKDIERTNINNNNTTNQKCNVTTCGQNEFNSMPHEITERILEAHNDLHIFVNKDPISSDSDSALSSAPPSISPQPPPNGEMQDIWHSVKNYTKELASLQSDNEALQSENEFLKKEMETLKEQINELEKTLLEAHKNDKMQQLQDRIQFLECREDLLLKEAHELREQNELLEFRILELEESHDKMQASMGAKKKKSVHWDTSSEGQWSLRSNSTPDTRDMWTDTERDPDDLIMYVDRADSGITSPHSHHHIDERNVPSPVDLSMLDQVSNEEIKRRLIAMTKRNCYDEDDKLCLLQVLALLNNLDALSQDSMIGSEDMMSIDLTKAKTSDYSSASSSPRSFIDPQSFQKTKSGRIVATVLPYSSTLSTPTDSPRKYRCWNSSSLQESGVFEGELNETATESTQTEPDDFPCRGELCAEIQKLNKFREKIEEVVTKSTTKTTPIISPNLSDQRRLQYYKDRLELLENKVLIYESSGDTQTKRLAERLQREVRLNSLVKELRQKVDTLEEENLRLEEEKCEFEEAENDTRLRLQRLEVDLEILGQRNIELEMSRDNTQGKLKDARQQCACLQETVEKCQERIRVLEESEKALRNKIELIKTCMPAVLMYITFRVRGPQALSGLTKANMNSLVPMECSCAVNSSMQDKLQELMSREQELTQRITELNRAYDETLESADNLWAQMEKDYKDRLATAKNTENCLKTKISQLEERLRCDSQCAQERISQLEEIELTLKHRICSLNRENKEMSAEHEALLSEYQSTRERYQELKKYIEGPAAENLDREKNKARALEEDLAAANKMLEAVEEIHRTEVHQMRSQLTRVNKELLHIEVTNSELREEVSTLETQVMELTKLHEIDEDKIRNLTDELRIREDNIIKDSPAIMTGPSLAQELGPVKRVNTDEISDLNEASMRLAEAIANVEECGNCTSGSLDISEIAKEIKVLADAILSHKSGKKMRPSEEVGVIKSPSGSYPIPLSSSTPEDKSLSEADLEENTFDFQSQISSSPIKNLHNNDSVLYKESTLKLQSSVTSNSTKREEDPNLHVKVSDVLISLPKEELKVEPKKENVVLVMQSNVTGNQGKDDPNKDDFLKKAIEEILEKFKKSLEKPYKNKPTMAEVPSEFRKIAKSKKSLYHSLLHRPISMRKRISQSGKSGKQKHSSSQCQAASLETELQSGIFKVNTLREGNIEQHPRTNDDQPIKSTDSSSAEEVKDVKKLKPNKSKVLKLKTALQDIKRQMSSLLTGISDANSTCGSEDSEKEIYVRNMSSFLSSKVEKWPHDEIAEKVKECDDIKPQSFPSISERENERSPLDLSCEDPSSVAFLSTDNSGSIEAHLSSEEVVNEKFSPLSKSKGYRDLPPILNQPSEPIDLTAPRRRRPADSPIEQIILKIRSEVPFSPKRREIENILRDRYERDLIFHKSLNKTMFLGLTDSSAKTIFDYVGIDCYEDVVKSMKCLKTISNLYAPSVINVLETLEEEITRKLILFYLNSKYRNYQYEVYIPVLRAK